MEERQYLPNSHKFREEQAATTEERKKVEKVIQGTAKTKKPSEFRKAMNNFISDDVPNLKTYVVKDVVIPTIKKIISETVDMVLFGRSRSSNKIGDRVSYRRYYDEPRTSKDTSNTNVRPSYTEVILESRGDAERVLQQMSDMLDTYDMVSIADLYDLVGITGEYTDHKYGWTNIRNAEIIRCREGYLIQMPKALPIK